MKNLPGCCLHAPKSLHSARPLVACGTRLQHLSCIPASNHAQLSSNAPLGGTRHAAAPGLGAMHRRSTAGSAAPTAVAGSDATEASADSTYQPSESPSSSGSQFNWSKQWYPVAVLEHLDTKKPHPFTLLGTPIVLWVDTKGTWRALEDKCPHR